MITVIIADQMLHLAFCATLNLFAPWMNILCSIRRQIRLNCFPGLWWSLILTLLCLAELTSTSHSPMLAHRWQRPPAVFRRRSVVLPRGLLQNRMSGGSKRAQRQALNGGLRGFRARRRHRVPLQVQHRFLRCRQSQKEDTKVSAWNFSSQSCW